ncbi:MAG: TonB-dependent receptor [Rhodospirillaceae bacterium]|nr:TonB-dependent receptor [Rhodospirillaceae bacterium]
MIRQNRLCGAAAVALVTGIAAVDFAALAQPALEEIVVTARKREESLREIPLSITAFSANDIEKKGFQGLEDIQFAAPGMQYSNQGGQIPGRYNSAIRFRGMNVNSDSPSLQLGSLFIDGIYVLGGTQSIPLEDIERIEVIKGPQSAYFGRNTFGGAINYITRDPSTTEYSGKVSALGATYDEYNVAVNHEGPLVEDKLAYRIGGRIYSKGNMFTASDGGELGSESSKSINATLFATPSDSLTLKLRGFYNKDDDSPPAGGIIAGIRNDSCTGKTVQTQDPAAPNARPRNYVCGIVPTQGNAISNLNTRQIIDSNTSLFPQQAAFVGRPTILIDNLVNRPNPPQVNVPFIDHMGLERDVMRFSASADYAFDSGYAATLQGGYNRLRANWIRDFGLSAIENWYSRDPQDAKDFSVEARIASPDDQALQWQIGGNYYYQKFIQSGSGGDAISLCTTIISPPPPGERCTRNPFVTFNSLLQNTDKIKAWGVFGSVGYDFTEQLTLNLEGRYQHNDARTAILTARPLKVVDKNFLPRAILRWTPTDETNVYGSYAKGVIQGQPNAQIATATPNELRQYLAQIPTAAATLPAEILDMYELGWKQSLWENRANFNLAAYYGEWKGQKGRGVVVLQEDCGSPSHGLSGGCVGGSPPGLGLPGQPARNLDGTPFLNSRNVNAPGTSKLWGAEWESAVAITENWDAQFNLTYARSKYKDFLFNFVQPISGFSQQKGNSNARFPKWIGALNSNYTANLTDDWDWFLSGDLQYFGKAYVDESNLAQCNDYWLVNARAGVEREDFRVEMFVKNLFDDDNWAACARWTDFDQAPNLAGLTLNQGIAVTAQDKRQFGIRTSIDF